MSSDEPTPPRTKNRLNWIVPALVVLIVLAMLLPAVVKAKHQAQRIDCLNNLKQIWFAAQVWPSNQDRTLPPSILSMSNQLLTPKVLVCPADKSKTRAADWSQFNANENLSYEYFVPTAWTAIPQRRMLRCPIHDAIVMQDGSGQLGSLREQPPGRR